MGKLARKIAGVMVISLLVGIFSLQGYAAKGIKDTAKIFDDVSRKAWYKQAVDYVYSYGLFSGTTSTTFEPETNVTRAMFVTVLAKLHGAKINNKAITKFKDVAKGQWYTGSIKWASDKRIVSGTSPTKFSPNTPITREQLCAILVKYTEYKKITLKKSVAKTKFVDDKTISKYAKNAVYI